MVKNYLFTSESVTEGHPDKICDKISDKILDCALEQDQDSKMAVESTIKDDLILIYGEANTQAKLDYKKIALEVMKDIGYSEEYQVLVKVSEQSKEINNSVDKEKICAGDQGIMFGYACDETEELMPLPISLAHKLTRKMAWVRKYDKNSPLLPDGKSQVTIEYEKGIPKRIDTILLASQHQATSAQKEIYNYLKKKVVDECIPAHLIDEKTKILINTSGSFVVGGSFGDSGTTGRKIVVDTYGGMGRVGGGCFSSKDPSKVDRTATYYARYVAKNVVYYGLASRCEIGLSYAIGLEKELSLLIETFGTEKVKLEKIYDFVRNNFCFEVNSMIEELDLRRPIYYNLASYGHFGREGLDLSWERIKDIE